MCMSLFRTVQNYKKIALACILVVVGAMAAYVWYTQTVPPKEPSKEVEFFTKRIGSLIMLPQSEIPTLATVSEQEKLTDQPFFAQARNGDKVLIFPQAKKAYLYRPTTHQLIEVAPLVISNTQSTPSAAPTPSSLRQTNVHVFNGTSTSGLATFAQTKIEQTKEFLVSMKGNAKKRDYRTTIIVDITGEFSEEAKSLAKILNATVGTFPANETTPSADLAVFLGADFQ